MSRRRVGRGAFAVVALIALATVPQWAIGKSQNDEHLAHQLADRDPGALVGGNTVIGVGNGSHLFGVPGRPNFIVALGDNATIVGGHADDELGALGENARIVAPRKGHTLVVGGPGSTVVAGGAGHDLIYVPADNATIKVDSASDEVILSGHHDRVVCMKHAHDETVYLGKGDKASHCRGHHNHVMPLKKLAKPAQARARAAVGLLGSGTDADPYIAPCADPDATECAIGFSARELCCFWSNEHVPAYACPAGLRYLLNHNYAPAGTTVLKGVEIEGLGPIGVSIPALFQASSPIGPRATGTRSSDASATNWSTEKKSYRVILHCVSDPARSY